MSSKFDDFDQKRRSALKFALLGAISLAAGGSLDAFAAAGKGVVPLKKGGQLYLSEDKGKWRASYENKKVMNGTFIDSKGNTLVFKNGYLVQGHKPSDRSYWDTWVNDSRTERAYGDFWAGNRKMAPQIQQR